MSRKRFDIRANFARARKRVRRKWAPILVYGLLALAILYPLLGNGYVLNLDNVVASRLPFSPDFYGLNEPVVSAVVPLHILWQAAAAVVPPWVLEKLLFFAILFVAGLSMHGLFPRKGAGAYFAGVLYVLNPFTYARFMAGQWGVLWAYALTPFAVKAFIDLLEEGGARNAARVALLSILVGLVQIHGFFLLFLCFGVMLSVYAYSRRGQPAAVARSGALTLLSGLLFLVLVAYWLLPALTASNTIIRQIGTQDMALFSPMSGSQLGIMFDIASMHGFWRGGYEFAKDILPFWWVLFALILFLAAYGFASTMTSTSKERAGSSGAHAVSSPSPLAPLRDRWVTLSLGLLWLIGLLLAVGAAARPTSAIFEWLWQHVPYFSAFRDSQKFVALLCLAYAFLGGLGLEQIVAEFKTTTAGMLRAGTMAIVAIALCIPPVYSFTMFGFHSQLNVTDYPREWYEVNDLLNQDKSDFNVLFLPWHMYMDFAWLPNADKRLANPAQQFFDKPVLAGDNLEMPGTYSESANPVSRYVEFLLSRKDSISNLGELLAPLDVKYVVLVSETDYSAYEFLYHQSDLTIERQLPRLTLFRNEHATARAYAVDSVVYVDGLEQYVELSKTQDVMEHLYVIGEGSSASTTAAMQKLNCARSSPALYTVDGTSRKYTVFTLPQNANTGHWELAGQPPAAQNLGFMPAFISTGSPARIVYSRFYRAYLPGYVISALGLGVVFWLRLRRRRSPAPTR